MFVIANSFAAGTGSGHLTTHPTIQMALTKTERRKLYFENQWTARSEAIFAWYRPWMHTSMQITAGVKQSI